MDDVRITDSVCPVILSPPTVSMEIDGESLCCTAGDRITVGGLEIRIIAINTNQPRPVTGNGKVMYTVTGVSGDSVTEYVRSEDRAREIFRQKFPGQEISRVSLT